MESKTASRPTPLKKLISFVKDDYEMVKKEIEEGWKLVSITETNNRYVGVLEQETQDEEVVYLPPKKKLKLSFT